MSHGGQNGGQGMANPGGFPGMSGGAMPGGGGFQESFGAAPPPGGAPNMGGPALYTDAMRQSDNALGGQVNTQNTPAFNWSGMGGGTQTGPGQQQMSPFQAMRQNFMQGPNAQTWQQHQAGRMPQMGLQQGPGGGGLLGGGTQGNGAQTTGYGMPQRPPLMPQQAPAMGGETPGMGMATKMGGAPQGMGMMDQLLRLNRGY